MVARVGSVICRTPGPSPRNGPESTRGRPTRLNKPAAAYAAGAIMNLQMNAQNRIAIEQACPSDLRLCAQLCSSSASSPAFVSAHCWLSRC